ncbi:MAG: DNA polymerase III subunit gamma/tau [Myxococcales bacterium]|nr:DNA polymerase III subunit gamma/tau [Myxococcales bacterium]MCB9707884.1 DNA polymerase III subunit gamma/tau [Myxococcales bacterium]
MSYTVFARKYRPQVFADLVGQEHITRTLTNAIQTGRIAHAFLLTGVRGVGKTTTARILAKALNCKDGPAPEPCNACDACTEIAAGVDMDVIEIDGASNNSVEDVRRLQETLPFQPARDRFKILIVDEVHMLSNSAFNALLKTLEEPPEHVKFVLATTEAHKVPITIRSRCQRYDYRLIPANVIAQRVKDILNAEGIDADDATIAMVSREAAGSLRDALTLLDQIVAFSGRRLDHTEVAKMLGIADRHIVFSLAEALLKRNTGIALSLINTICEQGMDLAHTLKQLLGIMRDLVVLHTLDDRRDFVDMTDEELDLAHRLIGSSGGLELQRTYSMLSTLLDAMAHSSAPRIDVEMGLVQIASAPPLQDMQKLLEELNSLTHGVSEQPRPLAPPVRAPAANPTASVASGDAIDIFEKLVNQVRASRPALAAVLEHGALVRMDPEHVLIAFETQSFYAHQAESPEALQAIADAAGIVMQLGAERRPKVQIKRGQTGDETIVQRKSAQTKAHKEQLRQKALAHPAVRDTLEIFPEAADKIDVRTDVD